MNYLRGGLLKRIAISTLRITIVLLIALLFDTFVMHNVMAAPWASASFDRCRNITLNNVVGSTLTNFPVYVNLSYDSDMQSTFSDIRFYNTSCNSGGSLLDYEIENYTSSNAYVWVRIPSLASGNNIISVYYKNNTAVSSGQNVTGVWVSNYRLVQHMEENPSGSAPQILDSSSFGINGTTYGSMTSSQFVSGMVDGSSRFDGSNDYVDFGSPQSLNFTGLSNFTISAWVNVTGVTTTHRPIVCKGDTQYCLKIFTNNTFEMCAYDGGWKCAYSNAVLTLNQWYYVVGMVNSSEVSVWVNGVKQGNLATNTGITADTYNVNIGRDAQNTARLFNGTIDEVRVSNISRSATWINMSYLLIRNQSSYVTIGNGFNKDSFFPVVNLSYPSDSYVNDSSQFVNLTFNATVSADGGLKNCSLWTDYTGAWSLNQTQNVSGLSNITRFNFTGSAVRTFMWNIICYDNFSQFSWGSSNRTVKLNWTDPFVDNPPIVSLSYPANNYFNDSSRFVNLTFNATVTDDVNLFNCSLWTNYFGTWVLNQTQSVSGVSNVASFNLTQLVNKTFIWNIQCYDNVSNFSWGIINRTVILNWTPPPNQPPNVTSVLLTPEYPVSSNDLYCTFIVEDSDDTANLTVNVSWYRNNVFNFSQSSAVTNSTLSNFTLGSGNLSVGQAWFCSVVAYDQKNYSARINSSSVTILSGLPPTISDIFLNSTSLYNFSSGNLTCSYTLADNATTSTVSWYKNSNPWMLLNMPFEGNSVNALKDYSGLGNNATNYGAVWNSTGGYNGNGSFMFNGSGSYLDLGTPSSLDFVGAVNFTITAWINLRGSTTVHRPILSKGDTQYTLKMYTNNTFEMCVYDTSWRCAYSTSTATLNRWYFVVGVVNGSEVSVWVDGVKQSNTNTYTSIASSAYNINIGRDAQNTGRLFNGSIDEVRVYNKSLSSEQILALYHNRTNIIVSQELAVDDIWQCRATPFSVSMMGSTKISNNITILGSPLVLLDTPSYDYYNDTSRYVNLTFNASVIAETSFVNCSLWTNYSGAWSLNQTKIVGGLNNITSFTLYNLTGKVFVWNIQCYDNLSNSGRSSINRTVTLNWTVPITPIVATNISMVSSNILSAGAIKAVICNASFEDSNGFGDILNVSATFYFLSRNASSPDNNTNHYTNNNCTLINTTANGGNFSCLFGVYYYADNGTWICNITAHDIAGLNTSITINTTVEALYALNISESGLSYQDVPAGSYSNESIANITNIGNQPINITVSGYGGNNSVTGNGLAMICDNYANISIGNQRFATNPSVAYGSKIPLSSTDTSMGFTIPRQTTAGIMRINSTYWQIYVPAVGLTTCRGSILFTAVAS
jgi:hypothetical protein